MVIGMNPKGDDMAVNVCKTKHLTNTRASGSDDALRLIRRAGSASRRRWSSSTPTSCWRSPPRATASAKQILNNEQRMKATKGKKA